MAKKKAVTDEVADETKTEQVAQTEAGCPLIVLRADDDWGFRAMIQLSRMYAESGSEPIERKQMLRGKVREAELWREEQGLN